MTRTVLWPAALLGLAIASAAISAEVSGAAPGAGPAPAADKQEDIEIMRRLLDSALAKTYGVNGPVKASPSIPLDAIPSYDVFQYQPYPGWTAPASTHPGPHVEGVYLRDYGVVYSATLPLPPFSVLPAPGVGAAAKDPPDDWDRTRKEIRGDKPEPETKVVPGHQSLSDVILKVLADNGKHFTSLADGEKIAVGVTFRGAANCASCHRNPWPAGPTTMPIPYNFYSTTATNAGHSAPGTAAPPKESVPSELDPGFTAPASAPPAPAWMSDVRNAVLLGDLHSKQGKTTDAIAAYEKAADQLDKVIVGKRATSMGLSMEDVPALLSAIDLRNKLATVYRQAGVEGSAGKVLREAADLAKEAAKLTGAPAPANPTAPAPAQALPTKLVVTASKKQLEDVASGKLTFEAFCKAATVDYVNPPGATTTTPSVPGTTAP